MADTHRPPAGVGQRQTSQPKVRWKNLRTHNAREIEANKNRNQNPTGIVRLSLPVRARAGSWDGACVLFNETHVRTAGKTGTI